MYFEVYTMNNRYILFDVETPNSRNDRMSAIGISIVENSKITKGYYTLVNPETHFDEFNIYLTNINPEMVKDKPTFPQLWQMIEPIFSSGLLMAHNAPFDMSVLGKCLRDYNISWKDTVNYACTCAIGKKLLPQLSNHKLNTISEYLGLELDHHNAASDCAACAHLLIHYLSLGADINNFKKTYDLINIKTKRGV